MARSAYQPLYFIIAGPNGAGKSTFAREYLAADRGLAHFINADLIAAGLSPFQPELVAVAAGSRFVKGGQVIDCPRVKLFVNGVASRPTWTPSRHSRKSTPLRPRRLRPIAWRRRQRQDGRSHRQRR